MAQKHTYRIIIARPGYLERVRIKEFADIFAATTWAQQRYAHAPSVRLCVEQVRLADLTELQQAALGFERAQEATQ